MGRNATRVQLGAGSHADLDLQVFAFRTVPYGPFACSAVQVYLPMSYVYGVRGTCKETPLTAEIRWVGGCDLS